MPHLLCLSVYCRPSSVLSGDKVFFEGVNSLRALRSSKNFLLMMTEVTGKSVTSALLPVNPFRVKAEQKETGSIKKTTHTHTQKTP